MAGTLKTTQQSSESILLNIEKISQSVNQEDVRTLMDAIKAEMGNHKLAKEEIEQLQSLMNVDALESAKWKSVSDVLKYLSVFALAENNPQVIKKVFEGILGLIGIVYPIVGRANWILTKVPDQLFTALIKIGGFASPEYLLYRGVKIIADKKSEKAKEQAQYNESIDESMIPLIIVSKNKMLRLEMNKLIQANDDVDEETIVGTKDGTVHPMVWNESAWNAFHDKLNDNDKVLMIGKIKGVQPLTQEQVRFEQFGVKYGWYKNIARIEADPKALSNSKQYKEFLSALNDLDISEKMKKNAKVKAAWGTAAKLALFPPLALGDLFREDPEVVKQQLMFGLYHFYMQGLDEFLNPQESAE